MLQRLTLIAIMAFATAGYGRPGFNFLKNEFDFYGIGGVTFKWNLTDFYTKTLKNDLQIFKINPGLFNTSMPERF